VSYSPKFRGATSSAPTQSVQNTFNNSTGVTILKLMPVYSNTSGDIALIDVSNEAQALAAVGITAENISHLSSGKVISSGRLEDVSISYAFGSALFISKTGTLTNVKPSVGSGGFEIGDFAIHVGVVVKNIGNPALKDILMSVGVVGQL